MTEFLVTLYRNGDEDFPYRLEVSAATTEKASKLALNQLEAEDGVYTVAGTDQI